MEDTIATQAPELESQLNDFDLDRRMEALSLLAQRAALRPAPAMQDMAQVNMHCHTFFSYNAYGHSPASLAWLARQRGLAVIGIVDFDVLDGVDEFLKACALVGVRGTAGIETRVFIPEFSDREINSPGEPGVYYAMGIGFTSSSVPPEVAPILASMRDRATRRNLEMMARVNQHLEPVTINYEQDVLPLTPRGNATERHLLRAYITAAERFFSADPFRLSEFWSRKLSLSQEQTSSIMHDYARFSGMVRTRLMKKGGVGYVNPGPEAFPSIEEFHKLIVACGALPCATWLDGTSAGEEAIEELLDLMMAKGAQALNIIPDRNWNVADPDVRRLKVRKLHDVVHLAARLGLPLNVGTEMNAPGNKVVDDFDVPELAPLRQAFVDGAYCIFGHTLLQLVGGLGYDSTWAHKHLPVRAERNAFYARAGRLSGPLERGRAHRRRLEHLPPTQVLAELLKA